jgi:crotonobetainyl-CoA:carnitine CoA-transferase CaiB-like acyl-CoA transferase
VLTGLYASTAILACLRARESSGHGYAIDLALNDCSLASQVNIAQAYLTSGTVPKRQGNAHLQIVPYQLFETLDGYLVLNVGNDSQWQSFCSTAGATNLGANSRYQTNRQRVELRDELVPEVAALMKILSTNEWEKRLTSANVPHAVVQDYSDIFNSEQTMARGMKLTVHDPAGKPVNLVGNPIHIAGGLLQTPTVPPKLGEQTDEVLRELGLSEKEVRELREKGVV